MHLAAIMARWKEFEQLGCQVVVVDSGVREGGLEWLQDRGYHFPLLLDQDRVFYRQVGLRRALRDVFSVKHFHNNVHTNFRRKKTKWYASCDFSGKGGDFIVDSTGKLLYAHLTRNQFDRPDVGTLVEFLQQLV